MKKDKMIKIIMAACAAVLLCAVAAASAGLFGTSGIGGYADAEKYTSGDTEITETVRNIEVNWTSGRVTIGAHAGNTVILQETAKRVLSEDEKLRWWLDGDTLRIQFTKPGIRLNMPEKELTVLLPEGAALLNASIQTTSGDIEIPFLKAEKLNLGSTSGDMNVAAEAAEAVISSTSGDITVRLAGETDRVMIGSTSGQIGLEAEKAGSIEAGATSGGIRITAAEANKVEAGSTSGNIYVSLGKMDTMKIGATSGSVTAKLPAEPGFTTRVSTTSGSFTSELALTKDGDRYVCGDGSAAAEIGTTSGDVRLEAAEEGAREK